MPIDNVPQFIRDNAQKGLDYLAEGFGGDGLTDATKREAREMADGNISDNKVRKMAPWFARHKVDGQAPKNNDPSDSEYPGAGLVAWLLWGGNANFDDAAQDWAQRQINRLDNETNKAGERNSSSDTAIIVDVDGTMLNGSVGIQKNIDYVNKLAKDYYIHIVTGRREDERDKTASDLKAAGVQYNALTLNNTDMASPEYKKETAKKIMESKIVKLAIDNGDSARAAYSSLGIETLNPTSINAENARSRMKKTERRTFTVKNIETREAEDGTMRMAGYAAVFNEASLPLPFIERIAPGAFSKTLKETPDVRLLINHEGLPMARTKNGTMRLYEDDKGLFFEAELANTQEARDLYTIVEGKFIDQMSFAFRVIRQKYNEDRSERLLTEVSLADGDVSIVTYPAYPTTSVEAREAIKRAALALKEGREMSPETTVALSSILDKLSESYDNLEEGKDLLEVMLGLKTLEPTVEVEDPEVELEPTDVMPESCDCCDMGCMCEDCMMCGGVQEEAAVNVLKVEDVPGQGAKIVGDFPSVLNFLPDNMPRSMSLRLAKAKRSTIK